MSSSFSDKEVTEFVHYPKAKTSLPVKKAALIVGHQPVSSMWVFDANIHIDSNGRLTPPSETKYVRTFLTTRQRYP